MTSYGQLIVESGLASTSRAGFPLNQKSKEKKKCTILHIGCMPLPPKSVAGGQWPVGSTDRWPLIT